MKKTDKVVLVGLLVMHIGAYLVGGPFGVGCAMIISGFFSAVMAPLYMDIRR